MAILGINAWLHDSAACLVEDGQLVAAVEEERFSRDDKHTSAFPKRAIEYCLRAAGKDVRVTHVAVNLNPMRAFEDSEGAASVLLRPGRLSTLNRKTYKHLLSSNQRVNRETRHVLRACGQGKDFVVAEVGHHDAHAASTFFVSPFEDAAVLTIDGRGEWATTAMYSGTGPHLERLDSIGLPHSLGLLYAAVTSYLGFKRNNDEYKVMGLASYGDPAPFKDRIRRLLRKTGGGRFEVATEYFEDERALLDGPALCELLGGPRRVAESELETRHKDIAAALQDVTEEVGVELARHLRERTGAKAICLAGGVALNCVMNTRILRECGFEQLYVQPAAYDAGGALGAAFWVQHQELGRPRSFVMDRADWGPSFEDAAIERILREGMLRYRRSEDIARDAAALVADGKIVGWFQGRAEWGPRALGHRSILADPTRPEMQDHVNLRVKHREDFRPFAPSATAEGFRTYFDTVAEDPFMTTIVPVRPEHRAKLPAITHVDGTARVQTVNAKTDPLYHRLITEFEKLRGVPVVLNTSFNVRGEPMVLTPMDALRCFFTTGLDHLAIGSFIVDK
jgi:carbamoyltransferase